MSSSLPPSARRDYGPPWGVVIAAGLLLTLELVLRLLNPKGVLPATTDRELAYRAVVPELLAFGAPDIAVVGSSRARRAVLAPELRSAMGRGRNRPSVGNFALGGAESEEIEATVRRLLEAEPKPRMLVWPISPREFEPREERPVGQVGYLWRLPDWVRARSKLGTRADGLLPNAIRNEAARYSYVARYRFAMRDLVEDRPRYLGRELAQILLGKRGESTVHGGIDPKFRTKAKNRVMEVDPEWVEKFIGKAYADPAWPNNYQAEHFRAALAEARAVKVPVLLVELPLHPTLVRTLPLGTVDKFRALVSRTAREQGARFVTMDRLKVDFELTDFHEHSHVNLRGAEKYTSALAPVLRSRFDRRKPGASARK